MQSVSSGFETVFECLAKALQARFYVFQNLFGKPSLQRDLSLPHQNPGIVTSLTGFLLLFETVNISPMPVKNSLTLDFIGSHWIFRDTLKLFFDRPFLISAILETDAGLFIDG